jgi:transcriptional regulator with XRE-family HTH domain
VTAGELLRNARHQHGLTQRQLAIRARTSQAAISRIERDVVSPTVAMLGGLLWLMNEELVLGTRAVDWGFDLTLLKARHALSPEERLRTQTAHADEADGAAHGEVTLRRQPHVRSVRSPM